MAGKVGLPGPLQREREALVADLEVIQCSVLLRHRLFLSATLCKLDAPSYKSNHSRQHRSAPERRALAARRRSPSSSHGTRPARARSPD